ncbi:MAG: alpha/beta hydrolase-fold protein [Polyangiaceae bacterium]
MKRYFLYVVLASAAVGACGDDSTTGGGGHGGTTWTGGSGGEPGTGAGGTESGGSSIGGSGGDASGGSASGGGGQGGAAIEDLDALLARLRADRDGTLLEESADGGWPVRVMGGLVVVSTDASLTNVAGDFNNWQVEPLTADQGFSWALITDAPGGYKFTDGTNYASDQWSRSYVYDQFGELSIVPSTAAHLERYFEVGAGETLLEPRTIRIWIPAEAPTHVLYLHDGQNLFDPDAIWGGWHLQDTVPPAMMLVGIDNTAARMDEYTQVQDDIGQVVGGLGDEYAAYVEDVVRPLVATHYGEAPKVGVMGSSLGGLISLHIGYLNPTGWDFVGSMSGTLGWGSIGPHTGETMIERYEAKPKTPFVVYLDSGGSGPCADSDGDGIQDDGNGADNYCETVQMRDVLTAKGYVFDTDLFHWHEDGAPHNEQAWAARVFRPFGIFAAL